MATIEAWIPLINTSLILISGFFLVLGYYFIRRKRVVPHRRCMLTATVFAGLFLVVYVARWVLLGTTLFTGEGWVRFVYLAILISHVILATLIGPLALVTLRRALRQQWDRHRRIARVTFPIWLYVVVTGWIVYYMLHNLPSA